MLEQSESEGNSLYITCSIRLKTLPEAHFIYKMWGVTYHIDIVYNTIKDKRRNTTQSTVKQLTKFV